MRKSFDLATAIRTVETPEVEELTFGELLRGWYITPMRTIACA